MGYLNEHEAFGGPTLRKSFCVIPPKDYESHYTVRGQSIDDQERIIIIHVYPCIAPSPAMCAPAQLIDQIAISVIRPMFDFDYSKTKNYLKMVPNLLLPSYSDRSTWKLNHISMKKIDTYSKTSIFSSEKKGDSYVDISNNILDTRYRNPSKTHCLPSELGNIAACSPYITLVLRASGRTEKVIRTYGSLIQAMSETGGFGELLMIGIGGLFAIYSCSSSLFKKFLSKELYGGANNSKYAEMIENEMDLAQILRELHGLRVLNRIYFKDAHLLLLPELLHKIKTEEEMRAEENLRDKKNSAMIVKSRLNRIQAIDNSPQPTIKRGLTKGMTFRGSSKNERQRAIDSIREYHKDSQSDMESLINNFFLEKLDRRGEQARLISEESDGAESRKQLVHCKRIFKFPEENNQCKEEIRITENNEDQILDGGINEDQLEYPKVIFNPVIDENNGHQVVDRGRGPGEQEGLKEARKVGFSGIVQDSKKGRFKTNGFKRVD